MMKTKNEIPFALPYTLYPIYAYSEDVKGQPAYEIKIDSIIPQYIFKEMKKYGIKFQLPSAKVYMKFLKTENLYRYTLVEPKIDKEVLDAYIKLVTAIERNLLSESDRIELVPVLDEIDEETPVYKDEEGTEIRKPFRTALYYVMRNMFGYNILTPLLLDPKIEDISINGIDIPVFVYHKEYEYMPTNIVFSKNIKIYELNADGEELLDDLVSRFISLTSKTISVANPIMDGMLPNKDRIAATFRKEVSANGSTFVIRRFPESPITILDLINSNVLSPEVAAYLWYAIDLKMPFMVIGVTGAGKTTVLGSILNLVKEQWKIVTIEDIPELNLAQKNWVQLYTRPVYGEVGKEVTLMDLLKLALRYRPDIIVVGEIRGEEAYVLFQAISTGHGGATTFHAYDSESAIRRLMNEPLNIPREWIPMMNLIITVRRLPVYVGDEILLRRRVVAIDEIVSADNLKRTVKWDPKSDSFIIDYSSMEILRQRAEEAGLTFDEVRTELLRRAEFLKMLALNKQITESKESYRLLKKYIILYSINPEEAVNELRKLSSTIKATTK